MNLEQRALAIADLIRQAIAADRMDLVEYLKDRLHATNREIERQRHEHDSAMKRKAVSDDLWRRKNEEKALRLRAVRHELKLMDMGEIVLN